MRPLHILLIVLALGTFLRFFALQSIPPGLYPDEAMNGVDALQALDRADFQVFYPNNNGREGLFINLQALSVQLFGATPWALRAVAAAVGSLTLFFFYLLSREVGRRLYPEDERAQNPFSPDVLYALLGTFLLAASAWHIHFSRMGFRAIMLPLLSSAALYFLLKGLRQNPGWNFSLAGMSLGLGLYTYIASRVVPVIAIVPFAADFARSRSSFRPFLRRWLLLVLFFLITTFPLVGYFVAHPQDFVGRAGDVSVFAADNPMQAFFTSLGKTLLMFHVHGDENWRHNASGSPQLDMITGLFFLLGFAIAVYGLFVPGRRLAWCTILLWFSLLLLPVITTAEGVPHALRAIGVLPPVFLLAAAGAIEVLLFLQRKLSPQIAQSIILVAVTLILLINAQKYFLVWAGNANVPGAYRADLVTIADYLNAHEDQNRYVIVNEGETINGIQVPSATIRFLSGGDPTIHYLVPEMVSDITPDYDRTLIVPTAPPSRDLEDALRSTFPSVKREELNGMILYRL